MARSMWRGAIQFGLVTIPVRLYLATESRGGLSFNLLHKEAKEGGEVVPCLRRIQMKTHCPEHGEISRGDTLRGYEWSKGQYVIIDEADFEAVPLRTVRAIEIEQFVETTAQKSAPIFVKQAYYLEPEPIGRKAFGLLKSVLAESGLQGICKIVLKDREQLSVLDPYQSTMLLSTIYWPDEVRDLGELDIPAAESDPKPAEIAMAKQLVSAMTGEFEPERYRDEYREALLKVIEAKVDGQPVAMPEPVVEARGLTDLMAVLEASVAAARDARKAAPAAHAGGDSAAADEPLRRSRRPSRSRARPSRRRSPRRPTREHRRGRDDQGGHPAATPQVGLTWVGPVSGRARCRRRTSWRWPARRLALDRAAGRRRLASTARERPRPGPWRCCRAMAPRHSTTRAGSSSRGGPGCSPPSSSMTAGVTLLADQLTDPAARVPGAAVGGRAGRRGGGGHHRHAPRARRGRAARPAGLRRRLADPDDRPGTGRLHRRGPAVA